MMVVPQEFSATVYRMMLVFTVISGLSPVGNHRGKAFLLTFLKNGYGHGDAYILILATEGATVSVENHLTATTESHQINANSSLRLQLNREIRYMSTSESIENKSVTVSSDVDIAVYGFDYNTYSAEGYLAIPVKYLADKYIAVSYTVNQYFPTLVIAATEDKTTVTVLLRIASGGTCSDTRKNGDVVTFKLGAKETVGIFCSHDLTGSYVTSDKPVSVISGHPCANVPDGIDGVDLLMEMLVPIQALGSSFVLHNLIGRASGAIYRAVASENGTRLFTSTGQEYELDFGEFVDVDTLVGGEMYLSSTHPLLLMMYAKGKKADVIPVDGDEFMSQVPPTDRFLREYDYDVDKFSDFNSYYAKTALTSDVALDVNFHAIPNCDYSVYVHKANGSDGNHITTRGVSFGGVVYGMKGAEAYGFPLGMVFDFDECENSPCANGGNCTDGIYSFTCQCLDGFSGKTCEIFELPSSTSLPSTTTYTESTTTDVGSPSSTVGASSIAPSSPQTQYSSSSSIQNLDTSSFYTESITYVPLTTSSTIPSATTTSGEVSDPSVTSFATSTSQSVSAFLGTSSVVISSTELSAHTSTAQTSAPSSAAVTSGAASTTFRGISTSSEPTSLSTSLPDTSTVVLSASPPTSYVSLCTCRCIQNLSTIDTSKLDDAIKKALLVPTESLSRTIRKKISMPDNRPTAVAVGYSGIVSVVLLTMFLMFPDLISILKFLCQFRMSDRKRTDSLKQLFGGK